MSAKPLPPRQQLVQVVSSLRRRLPTQLEGLLDAPRFADGKAALLRLDDDALASAAAAMPPDEAGALAAALRARWADLAEVVLDPHAAIVHPDEVWVGDRALAVALAVEAGDGVTIDEVVWDGATAGPGSLVATATASPPAGTAPAALVVRAHLRARTEAGRCALVATARIAIRQPRLTVSDDRRRIVAVDHTGRPAIGVALGLGAATRVTGAGGLVELDAPIAAGTPLTLAGIPAGRV